MAVATTSANSTNNQTATSQTVVKREIPELPKETTGRFRFFASVIREPFSLSINHSINRCPVSPSLQNRGR